MQPDLVDRARVWANAARVAGDSVTAVRIDALADAIHELDGTSERVTDSEVSAAARVLWEDYDQQYDASGVDAGAFEVVARSALTAARATRLESEHD